MNRDEIALEVDRFLLKSGASVRLRNTIERDIDWGASMIEGVQSLFDLPDEYLLRMKNFGETSLKELREILEESRIVKERKIMSDDYVTSQLKMKYFVLKPGGNNIYGRASRVALHAYAEIVEKKAPLFAKELKEWAAKEERGQTS